MDQLKEQSKKASEKLENFAKKTQQEMEKTSKKAQESIEKAAKQTQQELEKTSKKAQECTEKAAKQAKISINKSTKQSKETMESGVMKSAREAFHIDIKDNKIKVKPRRKDSSDSDSEEDGLLDDIGDGLDQLTLNQRALGAVGCYVLSGLFAFAATVMLFTGVHHVRFYALFYSLSNVATFCSLIFIMGQDRLQKRMLSSKRSVTGHAWMGSLVLTVVVAFFWSSHWFIVILLVLVQFGSMISYSLSYISFGRKFLHKYMAKKVVLVDAMDGRIDGK